MPPGVTARLTERGDDVFRATNIIYTGAVHVNQTGRQDKTYLLDAEDGINLSLGDAEIKRGTEYLI